MSRLKTDHTFPVKHKTVTLTDNVRDNLQDLGLSQEFLDITKSTMHKGKIGKSDFIKIKNFCSMKDSLKQCKDNRTSRKLYLSTTWSIKDWDLGYVRTFRTQWFKKNLVRKKKGKKSNEEAGKRHEQASHERGYTQ